MLKYNDIPKGTVIEIDGFDAIDGKTSMLIVLEHLEGHCSDCDNDQVEMFHVGSGEYHTSRLGDMQEWFRIGELRIIHKQTYVD